MPFFPIFEPLFSIFEEKSTTMLAWAVFFAYSDPTLANSSSSSSSPSPSSFFAFQRMPKRCEHNKAKRDCKACNVDAVCEHNRFRRCVCCMYLYLSSVHAYVTANPATWYDCTALTAECIWQIFDDFMATGAANCAEAQVCVSTSASPGVYVCIYPSILHRSIYPSTDDPSIYPENASIYVSR
jgi:hypothetical protein